MANIETIIKSYIGDRTYYGQNAHLQEWKNWYKGKVDSFHDYKIYNGNNYVTKTKKTLNMAKKGCEDWADLLLNEKTDIIIEEKEQLDNILKETKFWFKANLGLEKTFALGLGALLLSVNDISINEDGTLSEQKTGKINIDFINATKIYPITIKNDEIIECAFASVIADKIYISIHLLENDKYNIINIIGKGKEGSEEYNINKETDVFVFNTQSRTPWFVIIKPNIANNENINSPLGISVYANSIDCLKNIDNIFDAFDNEFVAGKKRTFVSTKALKLTMQNGELIKTFDENDTTFYVLPEDEQGKNYVQTDSSELRTDNLINGIQKALDLYSFQIGLGTGYYKFENSGVKTATEVISENSDTYRRLRKHEILLEDALISFTKAIMEASNLFTTTKFNENQEIQIAFDDSIIEDKTAERNSDRQDVNMGIMSKLEYRMKWYSEDEKTSRRKLEEAKSEQPDIIE